MKRRISTKRIMVLLTMMSAIALLGKAQSNLVSYPVIDQFNSSNFNPAFLSSQNNFTFSIFPLGGTNIGYNNQQVIKQLVVKVLSGVSTDQDFKDMLKSMEDHPSIHQNVESNFLNITYPSTLGVFNFRIKEVENFSAAFKGNLTDFLFKDGIQSAVTGQVQNLPAQGIHYREYSLGYSKATRDERFAAGIRAKIYFGKASFFSEISGIIIPNLDGGYVLNTKGISRLSFPSSTTNESGTVTDLASGAGGSKIINYLMNSGNPGVGVDLGINYRISPALTLSMSVIDLGKINWKTNLNSKSFITKPGEYVFPQGSYIPGNKNGHQIITKTGGESYMESVSDIFELTPVASPFSRPMPIQVFSGLKYQINPSLKISMVDRYVILKDLNYNSFSVLANYKVNNNLSLSTGYSIIGDSYMNIPFAVLFKKEFGQIYIGTDNLASFIIPSISDFAGFTFGTCFYLFKNRNLSRKVSDNYPFFSPRKSKKNKKRGLIRYNYPKF